MEVEQNYSSGWFMIKTHLQGPFPILGPEVLGYPEGGLLMIIIA